MTLADGQYRYDSPNGMSLVIGAGTPYHVETVTGLRALAPISAADTKRTGQQGSLRSGRRTYGSRVIQFDISVDSSQFAVGEDVEQLLDDLYAAFQATDDEGTLTMKRRAKVERVISCTPRLGEFPGNYDSWQGWAAGSLQLVSIDPRVYSSVQGSAVLVPGVSGGRVYPTTYPRSYPGVVDSTRVGILNEGNTPSPPTARFTGPIDSPGLLNITTGQLVLLAYNLPAGQIFELDFDSHSILLNGTPQRAMLDPASSAEWWELQPGNNLIGLVGSGTGEATLYYRSAWATG